MLAFYYDKSFEGLLCAVFDAFKLKKMPECLLAIGQVEPLLVSNRHNVEFCDLKYERVRLALINKISKAALRHLMYVWLSELPESDLIVFRYICKVFKSSKSIETDFADKDVLFVHDIAKKVSRERHRIMQFVRFSAIDNPIKDTTVLNEREDKIYFSNIAPIYNVLPLVLKFFKDRFADQKWVIYDEKRKYGYIYNLHSIEPISLVDKDDLIINSQVNQNYLSKDEVLFQNMWLRYCNALTIKERINPKLQRQQMPSRFWQYLPEMKSISK
ncbi:MAG: TIGR03915 family putative DNA repair protein [Gilliamella sp.]|uniref:TIGR03915 family putative DNA repair protein n=1 Tax=Gilliamella sp. TaxID=1891236 RepID=UPI0025DE58D4|nr:TIGR03915 family putative DNA repair protein [Gilliamella sp.]MCO6539717.1 TIGR03915 family putative DNA repair protein [Gilliamella sp.]